MYDTLAFAKRQIKIDDLTKHSAIMVSFSILAGFCNYLYQLSMGILLSPEQFGILFSLTSLLLIITVFTQTITLSVAKFTSSLNAEDNSSGINYLWRLSFRRTSIMGIIALVLLAALSPLISWFLNISNPFYLIILLLAIPFMFSISVNSGILQGLQRFLSLGCVRALTGFLKLAIAILLVYLGFGIFGGLAGVSISAIVVLLLTLFLLRNLSYAGNEKVEVVGFRSYAGLALLAIVSITVLTHIDIMLARHYLSAADAGNYSAISVLGKVAFYAPIGVASAMFPKTSEVFNSGGNHQQLFLKAVLLTVFIAGIILLAYGIFPQMVVESIFGSKYPLIVPHLFKYGLSMALLAVSFVLINYFLSINKTKVAYVTIGAMLIQIALLISFHSSIAHLVNVMLVCGVLSLFFISLFYLFIEVK